MWTQVAPDASPVTRPTALPRLAPPQLMSHIETIEQESVKQLFFSLQRRTGKRFLRVQTDDSTSPLMMLPSALAQAALLKRSCPRLGSV